MPPIMLCMLFMPPIPELIMLFMLTPGCDKPPNPDDGWPNGGAGVCLGAPPTPGGGGRLKPDGVLLPLLDGGGGSEKDED